MASNLLRYLIAFVLFLAAVLKTHQLSSGPLPSVIQGSVFTPFLELFNHRLLLTGVVEVELFAALILIFGRWTFPVWFATLFCFIVFAVVSMMKGLSGEASCGCFGKAAINPWSTASFDTVIVLLLLICRPASVAFQPLLHIPFKQLRLLFIVWLCLSVPVLAAVLSLQIRMHATLGKEFQTYDGKRAVQLRPATWKDKEFPLAPYLAPVPEPDFLKHGEHLVVLIKTDCERCHQLLDELQSSETQNVIVIEVPQLNSQPIQRVPFPCYKLNNYAAEWHADTPCVIHIADNVCVEVKEP